MLSIKECYTEGISNVMLNARTGMLSLNENVLHEIYIYPCSLPFGWTKSNALDSWIPDYCGLTFFGHIKNDFNIPR